jgi:hypothetical protein
LFNSACFPPQTADNKLQFNGSGPPGRELKFKHEKRETPLVASTAGSEWFDLRAGKLILSWL